MDSGRDAGNKAAISVAFIGVGPNKAELYISSFVAQVGADHVDDAADSLFANIDKRASF